MLRAYFDTTVPSGIVDGKVPADEIAALKAAFARKDIIAPLGPVILDELVGELEIDRAAMIRKLAVLRRLGTFRGMLKMPRDILKEAIEAYAAGIEQPPVQASEVDRRRVVTILAGVIAGSRRYDEDLKAAVAGVDGLKSSWLGDMLEGQRRFRTDPDWVPIEDRARLQPLILFFLLILPRKPISWSYSISTRKAQVTRARATMRTRRGEKRE